MRFHTAERVGGTVAQLLLGREVPLSQMELYLWSRYNVATARLNQQERPRERR